MREYYGNPEATAKALRDGWLYTGDMTRYDEDGFIWIVDRKKDVIITGGENVFPVEIEDFLHTNPKIRMRPSSACPTSGWARSLSPSWTSCRARSSPRRRSSRSASPCRGTRGPGRFSWTRCPGTRRARSRSRSSERNTAGRKRRSKSDLTGYSSPLEETIKYEFKDRELLAQAITHASFVNDRRSMAKSENEKLEYLGDAILNSVISILLFRKYREQNEGFLSNARSCLVRRGTLTEIARLINLDEHMSYGNGKGRSTRRLEGPLEHA